MSPFRSQSSNRGTVLSGPLPLSDLAPASSLGVLTTRACYGEHRTGGRESLSPPWLASEHIGAGHPLCGSRNSGSGGRYRRSLMTDNTPSKPPPSALSQVNGGPFACFSGFAKARTLIKTINIHRKHRTHSRGRR